MDTVLESHHLIFAHIVPLVHNGMP